MRSATHIYGDSLAPRKESYRVAAKAAQRKSGARQGPKMRRLELVRCPDGDYDRGVLFWSLDVMLTAALYGWPDGTTFRDSDGVHLTVRGREVYDDRGLRLSAPEYETLLNCTWRVVAGEQGRYAQDNLITHRDLAEGMATGSLPIGSRVQAPRDGAIYTIAETSRGIGLVDDKGHELRDQSVERHAFALGLRRMRHKTKTRLQ